MTPAQFFYLALVASGSAAASGEVAHSDAHAGGVQIANLEFALTVATWATFGLLALIIGKFGWAPFTKALDEREAKIASDVKRAEEARAQSEKLLADYDARIKSAKEETVRILAEARDRAEGVAAKIADDARKAADELTEKARRSIESEREKAVAQLNTIVADAAVGLAGKLMKSDLDAGKHRRLIDAELAEFEKTK